MVIITVSGLAVVITVSELFAAELIIVYFILKLRCRLIKTISGLAVVTTVAETGSTLDVMGGSIKKLVAINCTCTSEVSCTSPHNVGGHEGTIFSNSYSKIIA